MNTNPLSPGDLVGRPYRLPSHPPATFDCFSLVEYVRKQYYDLDTPIPYAVETLVQPTDVPRVWLKVEHMEIWQPTIKPRDGDVVKLERAHVGIYYQGAVLHAWRSQNYQAVILTRLSLINRIFPICQFLRVAGT